MVISTGNTVVEAARRLGYSTTLIGGSTPIGWSLRGLEAASVESPEDARPEDGNGG